MTNDIDSFIFKDYIIPVLNELKEELEKNNYKTRIREKNKPIQSAELIVITDKNMEFGFNISIDKNKELYLTINTKIPPQKEGHLINKGVGYQQSLVGFPLNKMEFKNLFKSKFEKFLKDPNTQIY